MSNYTKPEPPKGAPGWAYIGAEYVNGTGRTLLWTHDPACRDAEEGGTAECCTGELKCDLHCMSWQEMSALAMWMIEQADIARDAQLREQG